MVKEYFDYEIPIAKVDDAGITSTGSISSGNQLPALQEEYRQYRGANELWKAPNRFVSYSINANGYISRVSDSEEVELQ